MKKNRILSILMSVALILSLLPTTAFAADFGGGSGTEDDPYQISTAAQLKKIDDTPENLGKYYILTDDIDLEGETWTPIGIFTGSGETPNEDTAFHGTFDGGGHTITNLTIDGDHNVCAGLFGVVANGTVKDVEIKNAAVNGNCMTAAVAGYAYQSTIDNVDLSGTNSIAGKMATGLPTGDAPNMVAGIVGAGMDSTIQYCDVTGTTLTIEGDSSASMPGTNAHDIGLVGGGLEGCNLRACTAAGTITCDNNGDYIYGIGGLSGCAVMTESVTNCSADVAISISGSNAYLISGLLGYTGTTGDAAPSEITSCTAAGSINASGDCIGQLLGGGYYMDATKAYYPLPARFIVSGSSATTTGTPDLVGYATSLDTVNGSTGTNAVFDGGDGSIGNPYEISTAVQLYAVRYGLDQSYKLTADIDVGDTFDVGTMHLWLPIGSFVPVSGTAETPDPNYAFSGSFDGNGKTISNLNISRSFATAGMTMGTGLFGVVAGENAGSKAVVKNLTLTDVNVNGFCLVGGAVGLLGNYSTIDTVKLTGTNNQIYGCEGVGGVVGTGAEGSDYSITNCEAQAAVTVDPVDMSAYGYGVYPAATSGIVVGGLSGGSMENCKAVGGEIVANGDDVYGIGGVVGAPYNTSSLNNCDAENITITVMGANPMQIGGISGFAGTYGGAAPTAINGCNTANITIRVSDSAQAVGGVVGGSRLGATGTAEEGIPSRFAIDADCSSIGSMTGGTAYLGTIVGQMSNQSTNNAASGNMTINNAPGNPVGYTIDANQLLDGLKETYQPLFIGATLNADCNQYWHDAAAAVVGENAANVAVSTLKTSIGAPSQAAAGGGTFFCGFRDDVTKITFNGNTITVTRNGSEITDNYTVVGEKTLDEGGMNMTGVLLKSSLMQHNGFDYFLMMPDTPASTYHIEFRYGDDLDDLLSNAGGTTYANWLAAGIPTSAMEESTLNGGQKDNQLRQVIALFCEENLAHDATGALAERSPEALAQLSDFVGIWDANDATLATMHSYPGFENAKMYVDFKADGTAKTYVATDGVNYAVSSSYSYFAYDNSSSDKAGIYLVDSAEGVSTAPYEIVTSGGKQTLSFYSADGTAAYVKRGSSSTGSSGSGGSGSSGNSGSTSYTVTAPSAIANGSVTVTPENASKGDTVAITAVPNPGYEVSTLIVTDASGNELAVTDEGNGKYTFIMPASKVNISATFSESNTASGNGFADVLDNVYYKDAVIWAVGEGITKGTSATTFSPDAICTRAQAVTFLWRANGSPVSTTTVMPFNDVPADSYYYNAVLWAVEQGIIKGTSVMTFSPEMNCSRGQIVTMLWRVEGSKNATVSNPFTDIAGDAYYADAVMWAVDNEISKGTSETTFSPEENCTRAQIVTFLYRDMK